MVSEPSARLIDLHTHTTASDGEVKPLDLFKKAVSLGLAALSITDHDTIAGVLEVLDHASDYDIDFLPGVEISVIPPEGFGRDELHILGYGFKPDSVSFLTFLEKMQDARKERNPRMLEKLKALGFDISIEELSDLASGGLIGRPHMARLLVEKGYVRDINTAFLKYLGKGCPAYVEKRRAPWKEAIEEIRKAGGLAVLAHPGLIKNLDLSGLFSLLKTMSEHGLAGVELYYPKHSKAFTLSLKSFAERLGLLPTGGSDFHGSFKDSIALAYGYGDLGVPYSVYTDLTNFLESS